MSEGKHSWDRIPAWDGDKRQWKRYLRDVELYLETEKLDVDFSHGARLPTHLTGSAKKYAETSSWTKFYARWVQTKTLVTGMTALRSLGRAMEVDDATKNGQFQEFFYKKLQRRPGQPMVGWVNVFERAVLDRRAKCRAQEHGLAPFRKEQFDPGATRACVKRR